jgi:hypothetical protein
MSWRRECRYGEKGGGMQLLGGMLGAECNSYELASTNRYNAIKTNHLHDCSETKDMRPMPRYQKLNKDEVCCVVNPTHYERDVRAIVYGAHSKIAGDTRRHLNQPHH